MYKPIEPSITMGRWSTMTQNLRMFLPDLMLRRHHLTQHIGELWYLKYDSYLEFTTKLNLYIQRTLSRDIESRLESLWIWLVSYYIIAGKVSTCLG